jgi:hypothetical protein
MRKWHRWLSVFAGIVILFIAITGVASQIAAIYANGALVKADTPGRSPAAPPSGRGTMTPGQDGLLRPPQTPARKLVGLLHHLHSGESFGPVGVIVSTLSGLALIFFAISGMWMYVQMFLRRKRSGFRKWFWK